MVLYKLLLLFTEVYIYIDIESYVNVMLLEKKSILGLLFYFQSIHFNNLHNHANNKLLALFIFSFEKNN